MVFPAHFCKFYQTGLAKPYCVLKSDQLVGYCEHKEGYECDQWITSKGETEEQILERIVMGGT